jgi:quercetin dioxygenase-like cupin family protein
MTYLIPAVVLFLLAHTTALSSEFNDQIQSQENLSTTKTWDDAPIHYPSGTAKVTGAIHTIPPGIETGWHLHPVPCFALVLEGELVVELKDGRTKKLKAGDTLAEVIGTLHNGKNTGKVPLKIAIFYIGNTELKNTILCP